MAFWYYCMKCGAKCAGYGSKDFATINEYIELMKDGRTVFFESTFTGFKINVEDRRCGTEDKLSRLADRDDPVFEKISYTVLNREWIPSDDTHPHSHYLFTIRAGYKLNPEFLESRHLSDRYELFDCGNVNFSWEKRDKKNEICPICGNELMDAGICDMSFHKDFKEGWEDFFETSFEKSLASYEKPLIKNDSEDYVEELKNTAEVPMRRISAKKVDVQKFLEHFINVEKNIMLLTEHLKNLLPLQYRSGRTAYREQIMRERFRQETIEQEKAKMLREVSEIKEQNPLLSEEISESDLDLIQPTRPIAKKSYFFNRKRIEQENAMAMDEYEKNMELYQKEFEIKKSVELEQRRKINAERQSFIQQEEKRLSVEFKKFEANLPATSGEKTDIQRNNDTYLAEIAEVKEQLRQLCNLRAQFIASGIVHPKYIDFVALTTIYEYFETGRCTTLTGPDGAYNIYESEIRADRIVARLDKIIRSLESIKANQYQTYSVLKEINQGVQGLSVHLSNISQHTEAIANNTAYIAYNTAKTAHYAKINAELTNALGFMVALS